MPTRSTCSASGLPCQLPDGVPREIRKSYEGALHLLLQNHSVDQIADLVEAYRRERLAWIRRYGLAWPTKRSTANAWHHTLPPVDVVNLLRLVECLNSVAEIQHYGMERHLGPHAVSELHRRQQQRRSRLRPRLSALDRTLIIVSGKLRAQGKKHGTKLIEKELRALIGKGVIQSITKEHIYWQQSPGNTRKRTAIKKLKLTSLPSKISRLHKRP